MSLQKLVGENALSALASDIKIAVNAKADSADVYTKVATDALLASKADAADTFTKDEVTALIDETLPEISASGAIANFDTDLSLPLVECKANIVATGGNGTPDNPNPINGYSSANITRCGVNLFDVSTITPNKWLKDDYSGDLADNVNYVVSDYIPVKPNTTYYKALTGSDRALAFNKDKESISEGWLVGSAAQTFTTPNDCCFVRFSIANDNLSSFTLNYPSTDTTYAPYNGQTYTIAFGQTVYGGVLDVTRGKLHVTHQYITIASSNIIGATSESNLWRVSASQAFYDANNRYKMGICNMLTFKTAYVDVNNNNNTVAFNNDYGLQLVFRNDSITTEADAITFVTTLEFVYPLATPFDIDLTPVQINALIGVNNVFNDTNGDTEVKYVDKINDLSDLDDVQITSPTNGQLLKFDGTKWVNGTGTGTTPWTDVTDTLVAGNTSITISDASITTNSTIEIFTDADVDYESVSVATGSVTITFEEQASDLGVKVRVS